MQTYSGIGSRSITDKESKTIEKIANKLSKNFVLFSGNAPGADQSFQTGSKGNCVLFLPWAGFEEQNLDFRKVLDVFDLGKSREGMESVGKFHPNKNLTYGQKLMMSRNYHQIMGYKKYPKVSFVVCCANEDEKGNVEGGTGQACRIAKSENIPIINIRIPGWQKKLTEILKSLKEKS